MDEGSTLTTLTSSYLRFGFQHMKVRGINASKPQQQTRPFFQPGSILNARITRKKPQETREFNYHYQDPLVWNLNRNHFGENRAIEQRKKGQSRCIIHTQIFCFSAIIMVAQFLQDAAYDKVHTIAEELLDRAEKCKSLRPHESPAECAHQLVGGSRCFLLLSSLDGKQNMSLWKCLNS